jgi:hypothetical protein
MKKTLIFLNLLISLVIFSQKTEKLPLRKYKIAVLSDLLRETSGLTFFKDRLYTINDGGNPNIIYEIDKNSGKILKKIQTNFPNKDWEAITNDGENLYIGDFGNNAGNRRDLTIYSIDNQQEINVIKFSYQNQKDFSVNYLNHDFDAEAMVFINNKIHLFTKEWSAKKVSHYIINPKSSENQSVTKSESFNTGFVVTDAAYYENKLYVIGYTKKAKTYLMIFEQNDEGLFFSNPTKKYRLGSALTVGQIEGIAVNTDGIYISNEGFSQFIFRAKPNLYFVPFDRLKK